LKNWRGDADTGARQAPAKFPPTPYAAVYRVREQTIEVMRIHHAGQNR
jgi:hypothetical protein